MTIRLLANGRVWTGAQSSAPLHRHEAIAIEGSRVAGAGSVRELRARHPRAEEIDLSGRTVVPGLVDGHSHAIRGGAAPRPSSTGARTSD